MGRRASAYTESRPGGETVDLEFQAKKRGKYARLPADVILDGRNFNIELVRKGWSPEMNSQSPPIKKECAWFCHSKNLFGSQPDRHSSLFRCLPLRCPDEPLLHQKLRRFASFPDDLRGLVVEQLAGLR